MMANNLFKFFTLSVVYVICVDAQNVRLVGGPDNSSGRVEVFMNNAWGTVCDKSWDRRDALVVCKQLGWVDVLEVKIRAYFGEGTDPVHLGSLQCTGEEEDILDCQEEPWYIGNCPHERDAGVICSEVLVPTTTKASVTTKVQVATQIPLSPELSNVGLIGLTVVCAGLFMTFAIFFVRFLQRQRSNQKGLPDLMECTPCRPNEANNDTEATEEPKRHK